jgi:hypothetical protein
MRAFWPVNLVAKLLSDWAQQLRKGHRHEVSMPVPTEGSPLPRLNLIAWVDRPVLDQVRLHLIDTLYTHKLAGRRRYIARFSFPRFRTAICYLGMVDCALGFAFVLWYVSAGLPSPIPGSHPLLEALLFGFVFIVCWIRLWRRPGRRPWRRYWRYLARVETDRMLKQARAAAPFSAEYTVIGRELVYMRVFEADVRFQWRRRLRGWSLEGAGYTLLFKKQWSWAPYGIILHPPCAELNACLRQAGVQPIVPTRQADGAS